MEELKKHIDSMTYKEMLHMWRYAETGSPYFQGEIGEYFSKVMSAKRPTNSAQISKEIGFYSNI